LGTTLTIEKKSIVTMPGDYYELRGWDKMIIDTHTHFYDPSRPQGVPWPPPENKLLYRTVLPDDYKALSVPEGVRGTVVVEASAWLEDNQWVLDLAAGDPFILGLVGHIEPGRDEFAAELDHYAGNPIFRGIRCGAAHLGNVREKSLLADMERLSAKGLTLDVLIRKPVDGVLALATSLPELRIVVDHIAHMPIDGQALDPEWIETYQQMAEHPRICIKVSALMEMSTMQPAPDDVGYYRPILDALWETFGEDRLIYGSNWPVCERAGDFASGIRMVKAYLSGKGRTAYEKFFRRNAEAVYGIR
jgi:L-fuconolactonase